MRRRGSALLLLLVATTLALGACENAPASPSAIPELSPPSAGPAAPTAAELEAIRFRTENSLQADLAHVRAVAADPTAGMEFGVPLLPSEFDELMSRSADADGIIEIVQAEAAKAPGDYCGLYLDNANEGAVTSGWKANRVLHELAIRSKLRPSAKVAFIDCRFSEPEVNRVCELLREADHDWMKAIPAELQGFGCGNMHFRVEMQISSAVPEAADQVLHHYSSLFGLPPGILTVESDGTGVSLVPWGEVRVFVARIDGTPVGDSNLSLFWKSDVPGLACGFMDVGFGVNADGKATKLPCQEGPWTIQIIETLDDVYGEGTVLVRGGETVDLRIRLTREPPA